MLIYSILNENKKKLKFLSKSDENIDLSMTAITEFKKHGVLPEHLQTEIEKTEDEYLKTKLKDMFLIYQNFEEKLQGEYIEDTDLLTMLSENIEETELVKDSLIYIDEFAGFTYQEYEILKKFIKLAKQVTITVCTDSLEPSLNPDTDIFYSNKITVSKILNLVKEDNLKLEKPIFLTEEQRFKTGELQYLEKNIFNNRAKKYNKKVENIKLFLAKNQYSEIENVAKQITKLVRDENFRYKDISVITKNIDTYSSLVRAIFEQYDIPVFIDEKRDLNQNIIVQYILSIFEIFTNNFSKESVFNYLKIGFSELEEDDIFKLENYCTKWGIKQNKWKKEFTNGKNDETKDEIDYLNKLRKQIIEPLIGLKEQFGDVTTTTKAVYEFLQKQKIEQKINIKINELQEIGQIDLANEYISSYKIILNIFDEMVLIFGKEKLGVNKYIQILKTGLKNSELGKIPGTQDQVIVGDVDRSRSHKVDTIFIIGLNDGSFPSVNKSEGFFGDKDREILKSDGIELAKGTIENLYEENFNIYKAFTTAERRLYLSYSSSEAEGKSLRPSMMINKIKKIFPELKEESDIINRNYEITNQKITYQELLENISQLKEKNEIENIWYTVYEYYKNQNDWNYKLQKDLEGIDYTNIPENINKNSIEKLYGNTLNTSVSKLEKFAQCPFSYFLQYGLKLKEKEELKIQSFDTGSFMHETIDEFFKKVKEENINLAELVTEEEKIQELVNNVVEEKLDMGKKYTFVATAKYKVLVKRLKRIVAKALKYIIEGLVYSEFNIEGTEIEFGKKGKYKPILIQLEDGKKVEIVGKIDRVDTAKSDDGKYLRIIDYKSSAKNIDLNEVYAGLQIQLLTYMDAVCKEEDLLPAGVLYFSLLEQMIKADKKISEEQIEEELRKNFKMKGLILADIKVIKMHDKHLETGASKLIPASITKSGDISEGKTSGVNKEQFKILQDYIYKTIKQISKEILSGKIELKPYNKNGKKPCEYCSYKAICGFNPRLCGNSYNYIDKKSKDDIILKMQKELKI
ncbi:MAG: helicase-exonuclease AddAB subunit AddB [Clostridia bacterium]|nr:helicase-exonuclease AddAB subunit AddB [Clostridia bacterium]